MQTAAAHALAQLAANHPGVRDAIGSLDGLNPLLALLNGAHVPAQVVLCPRGGSHSACTRHWHLDLCALLTARAAS